MVLQMMLNVMKCSKCFLFMISKANFLLESVGALFFIIKESLVICFSDSMHSFWSKVMRP